MPNGNTAGAERQYRAMDGAVPNRDTEGANRRDYSVQSFPSEAALIRLVGAVCYEASEDWSSRRYMDPAAIEGLWEIVAAPVPDPTEEQLGRARARIVALSGLDEGATAA